MIVSDVLFGVALGFIAGTVFWFWLPRLMDWYLARDDDKLPEEERN